MSALYAASGDESSIFRWGDHFSHYETTASALHHGETPECTPAERTSEHAPRCRGRRSWRRVDVRAHRAEDVLLCSRSGLPARRIAPRRCPPLMLAIECAQAVGRSGVVATLVTVRTNLPPLHDRRRRALTPLRACFPPLLHLGGHPFVDGNGLSLGQLRFVHPSFLLLRRAVAARVSSLAAGVSTLRSSA